VLISLAISLVLALLVMAISLTRDSHRDKVQPFECGFEAISSARISFSIKFYMVVIIF
jgi:NADH-quinone oxidoreductase subunit A